MAKSDILVKFKAETQQYDANVAKAKKQIQDFAQSNYTAGGALKQMTGQLVASAAKYASWGAAVAGAMKLAKDAFFANEQQLDEWGRTVKSAESLYDGFLNSLNTGDISGFLSNIDQIVRAARNAYGAMDELGTFNAFNQRRMAQVRRDFSQSMADYRMGEGSKENVTQAAEAYKKELRDLAAKQEEAYNKAIEDLALKRGVSTEGLRSVLTGTYDQYKAAKGVSMSGSRPQVQFLGPGNYAIGTESYAVNDVEKLGEMLKNLNDTELQSIQALGAAADTTGEQIASIDRQLARVTNGRGSGKGGGGGGSGKTSLVNAGINNLSAMSGLGGTTTSMAGLTARRSDLQGQLRGATDMFTARDVQAQLDKVNQLIKAQPLALQLGISEEAMANIIEQMSKLGDNIEPIKITVSKESLKEIEKDGKDVSKSWNNAASVIRSVGGALETIEDPAGKITSIIAQAIANIVGGYAAAIGKEGGMSANIWVFLASAAAALVEMGVAVATVKKQAHYSEGGIVKGTSYSGDNILANGGTIGINAGELVLNRAQQNNLASQLTDTGRNLRLEAVIDGDKLRLVMNNSINRRGRGEIVTSRTFYS